LEVREKSLPSLAIKNLCASYGRLRVLHEVALEIGAGELVSLIGPNGAGKTTLLRAISRLVKTEGQIWFDGEDITKLTPQQVVARGIVQSPEGRKLFPDMTVKDNLELGAFLRRNPSEIRSDLERVCELFPILWERREQKAGTMSGGEQQMLAIGRALMCRPRILLLDEPSFGIAPIIVDRIFAVIQRLNQEGLTTLLVEQNVSLALDVATRAYVLEGGRVALSGKTEELSSNEAVREAYLGM
jgi:branched-chain amino acid transport system ATP-binding protein